MKAIVLDKATLNDLQKIFAEITASATGKASTPTEGEVSDVTPGSFPDWQFYAFALLRLLQHAEQRPKAALYVRRGDWFRTFDVSQDQVWAEESSGAIKISMPRAVAEDTQPGFECLDDVLSEESDHKTEVALMWPGGRIHYVGKVVRFGEYAPHCVHGTYKIMLIHESKAICVGR